MNLYHLTMSVKKVVFLICVLCVELGCSSEFPDRECCDSAPPPPPNYHTVTSSSSSTTTTIRPRRYNPQKTLEHTTLNCLESKRYCDQDPHCSAVLKDIPLLCGPELVACSTVTVSRCQAALRTLSSFGWFQPTCLCKEERLDPICNAFRHLVFDHPCVFVQRKEVDMHPLRTIPTCEQASNICKNNSWCLQLLDDFAAICTVVDEKCSSPDREGCVNAWLKVRETPLLGCLCPNSSDQNCMNRHALVNKNPCVDATFMQRTTAMTNVGVTLGSALVRPLPLSPVQPPSLPPTSLLVACIPSEDDVKHSDLSMSFLGQKSLPCRIESFLLELPQTDPEDSLRQIKHIVGTCQTALEACQNHEGCQSALDTMIQHCRMTFCNPEECRKSVANLYEYLVKENIDMALQIGLCICRRMGGRSDTDCVAAQELLHPECAEGSNSRSINQCHLLGRKCRDDRVCRYRLEYYEHACAADTMTGRCAGQHRECMKAAMGLFGSPLHINCVCKGDDLFSPSKCLAWKRLLWGNPCVVESQLTYYLPKMQGNLDSISSDYDEDPEEQWSLYSGGLFGGDTSVFSPFHNRNTHNQKPSFRKNPFQQKSDQKNQNKAIFNPTRTVSGLYDPNHTKTSIFNSRRIKSGLFEHKTNKPYNHKDLIHTKSTIFEGRNKQRSYDVGVIRPTALSGDANKARVYGTSRRTSSAFDNKPNLYGTVREKSGIFESSRGSKFQARKLGATQQSDVVSPKIPPPNSKQPLTPPPPVLDHLSTSQPTVFPSRAHIEVTSALPDKYCKVTGQLNTQTAKIVEAGEKIRLYKDHSIDCSEICTCTLNEEAFCKVLECATNIPCETRFAVFNHNAPGYQADRGECTCFSGDFICMRPKNDDYHLPPGLFLLLGFSHREEAILRTVTEGGAVDALLALQKLVKEITEELVQADCTFELHQNTTDNLVLQIRLRSNIAAHSNTSDGLSFVKLQQERDLCRPTFKRIEEMINGRDDRIKHHVRLSLFIKAEVLYTGPSARTSTANPLIISFYLSTFLISLWLISL